MFSQKAYFETKDVAQPDSLVVNRGGSRTLLKGTSTLKNGEEGGLTIFYHNFQNFHEIKKNVLNAHSYGAIATAFFLPTNKSNAIWCHYQNHTT